MEGTNLAQAVEVAKDAASYDANVTRIWDWKILCPALGNR